MKVHLDTDLGGDPDDLCALALLLAWPGVEISGITTCTERGGKRAGYVRYALRLAGREDIPVASGSEGGLSPLRWPAALPDEPTFWPESVALSMSPAGAAMDLLGSSVEQGATIIGIGPYTNLALFDVLRPGRLAKIQVVLMGGVLPPLKQGLPEWDAGYDYNTFMDIAATERVLACCDPILVTLNASAQAHLRRKDLRRLQEANPLASLLARQAEAEETDSHKSELAKTHAALPDDLLNFHHDPLACAVALGWNGATVEERRLRIDTSDGFLRLTLDDGGRAIRVVTEVNGEAFNRMWLDTVATEGTS